MQQSRPALLQHEAPAETPSAIELFRMGFRMKSCEGISEERTRGGQGEGSTWQCCAGLEPQPGIPATAQRAPCGRLTAQPGQTKPSQLALLWQPWW